MPTALVLTIHPEPHSFTAAWAVASASALRALGYTVLTSDPYASGFDPALRADQFPNAEAPFDPLKAMESIPSPQDVRTEVDMIHASDLLVIHFPLWWFGPPAMLKGWLDRVLVHGALHDVDRRFDAGICRGKRVLFCVTTGARASECGQDGKEADTNMLLWPTAYALRYCGFDIYAPLIAHGVHGYHRGARKAELDQRLSQVISAQRSILEGLANRPLIPFNADADFNADGRLRPSAPSHSPFIRHP